MKKVIATMLLACLILSGCQKQEKEEIPPPTTKDSPRQEIVEHNKSIDEATIELIQFNEPKSGSTTVTIETNLGEIICVLYPEKAPVAVDAFISNINRRSYTGSTFHTIIENFYIESSKASNTNPSTTSYSSLSGKTEDEAYTPEHSSGKIAESNPEAPPQEDVVGVEQSLELWHFRGALALRDNLADSPNSDLSDFFIVQASLLDENIFLDMEEIGYPKKVIDKYKEVGGIPGYDTNFTVFGQVISGMETLDAIAAIPVDKDFRPLEMLSIIQITIDTYSAERPPTAKLPSDTQPSESNEAVSA